MLTLPTHVQRGQHDVCARTTLRSPFPNAVSCSDYTCCPSGNKCVNKGGGYSVVSTCVPESADPSTAVFPQYPHVVGSGAGNFTGDETCKTGPPNPYVAHA